MAGVYYNNHQLMKMLKKRGYKVIRTNGSHKILSNGDDKITIKDDMNGINLQRELRSRGII